ncbi:VanZ family protein [Microbacterium pumilum]|uniref:VanZ-like domain-containing protein n=1 Tax=Microbacterium pumilum TaxID=344165 RepID=A0ABN2S9M8_9MICO
MSRSEPRLTRARRVSIVVGASLLALYLVVTVYVVLSPERIDGDSRGVYRVLIDMYAAGWPRWITYDVVQSTANALLALPLGFFLAMLFRRERWWVAALICSLAFLGVEVTQLFIPARVPSVVDWVANSFGGLLGALIWYAVAPRDREALRYR